MINPQPSNTIDVAIPNIVLNSTEMVRLGPIPGTNYSLYSATAIRVIQSFQRTYDVVATRGPHTVESLFLAAQALPECPPGMVPPV